MINNLPKGWEIEELGKVGKIFTGSSAPQEEKYFTNGKYPFVRVSDLSNKKFNKKLNKTNNYINDYCLENTKQTFANKGTIIFAKSGMSVRNNHRAILDIDSYIVSHLCAIYIENKYTREYIYYLLCKLDMVRYSENESYPSLKTSTIKLVKIPVPPLQQQEKIVKVLDLSSNLIEKQKELLKNYDLFLKSKFIEMFGDPISNPMGWEWKRLEQICNKITDGTHDTPERLTQGIPFITGKHIRKNFIDYENCDYVDEDTHKNIYKRCNPEYGDILYTNIGVNLGTAAINRVKYEFSMKNVGLLKNKIEISNSCFISFYLNNEKYYFYIKTISSIGGAQQFLSLKEIKKLKIFLPPIELQNKFASIVEKIEIIKEKQKQKLKQLENLHNSLMQKAFKGEIE